MFKLIVLTRSAVQLFRGGTTKFSCVTFSRRRFFNMRQHPTVLCLLGLYVVLSNAELDSCPAENITKPASNTDVITNILKNCKYDKTARPGHDGEPIDIYTRIYVYFLGNIEAQSLQFTAYILVRFRWLDERLEFKKMAPNVPRVVGESSLLNQIWRPHVYLVNEKESKQMGASETDVLVTIYPDGTVLYSSRMKVTLFCLMKLQKFPFDQQECPLVMESWTYNVTELMLAWEENQSVIVNKQLHLTEYSLQRTSLTSSFVHYTTEYEEDDIIELNRIVELYPYGRFAGNFSSLTVKFQLAREVGFYIMDFYVPSILLVVVSWVSFWLDPNAVPGRTTLGSSTMLAFVTLTRNAGGSLPKVSYIKATEIWFIVCTGFIFGSLVEFAFVNTIWRRKQNVALKKVNSKYILKSTLTPQSSRKQYHSNMDRCQSWPSVIEDKNSKTNENMFYLNNTSKNELTVHSIENISQQFQSNQSLSANENTSDCENVIIPVPDTNNKGFTTMTPQEIADWIDRRSRIMFPAAFILFNFLYWGFVWI